jgi:hypothetical protein
MIFRPLRGLLDFRGLDPRVTLAMLAHPGLNSVAAPRLVVANIRVDVLPTHAQVCFPPTVLGLMTQINSLNRSRPAGLFINVNDCAADPHFIFRLIRFAMNR